MSNTQIFDMGTKHLEAAHFERYYWCDRPEGWRAFWVSLYARYGITGCGLLLYYRKVNGCVSIKLDYDYAAKQSKVLPDGLDFSELSEEVKSLESFKEMETYCTERPANTFTKEELKELFRKVQVVGKEAHELEEAFEEKYSSQLHKLKKSGDPDIQPYQGYLDAIQQELERLGFYKIIVFLDDHKLMQIKRNIDIIKDAMHYSKDPYGDEDLTDVILREAMDSYNTIVTILKETFSNVQLEYVVEEESKD